LFHNVYIAFESIKYFNLKYAILYLLIKSSFDHNKTVLESHTIKHNIDLLSRHSFESSQGEIKQFHFCNSIVAFARTMSLLGSY